MFRGIIRLMLVAIVLVAAAFFFIGYWSGERFEAAEVRAPRIDTRAAREAGAEIGAKMVLDDLVKARTINVTTEGSTVVLSGTVHSPQERERSLALARETEGVTSVVDRLTVR